MPRTAKLTAPMKRVLTLIALGAPWRASADTVGPIVEGHLAEMVGFDHPDFVRGVVEGWRLTPAGRYALER